MNKPNIVYICADEMRADSMHHLGNEAAITPNLDALAAEGVSFRNAYCQNPVCVPSRCCFLTGHYSHTLGHRTIHYQQNEFEPNILKTMKKQGYEVIWAGKNHVVPLDDISAYCDVRIRKSRVMPAGVKPQDMHKMMDPDKSTVDITDPYYYSYYKGEMENSFMESGDFYAVSETVKYLQERQKSNPEKPFFLYLCLVLPHPPYAISSRYYGKTDRTKLPKRIPNVNLFANKPSMLYGIWEKEHMQS
ncbi:MAG: sulfatase-like hydrolase/transferase [Erysipelotrichaceae bacterium]|nr:sulfatase-like hydrolase/transferase [Erysipelotrichaceae bacterium]